VSDVLASFGVGGDQLPSQTVKEVAYPRTHPGRVAHIDADFLAYQVSAETKDELDGIKPRKSLEDMQNNARRAAEHLQRLVGAETYVCHITASASNKGGAPIKLSKRSISRGVKVEISRSSSTRSGPSSGRN
jgi:hypothetical protein